MQFRTEVSVEASEKKINLEEPIFCIGSCFSQEIGILLNTFKFQVITNPFGTLYNPDSIFTLVKAAYLGKNTAPERLIEHDGVYFSYNYHSEISAPSEVEYQNKITSRLQSAHEHIQRSRWLVLTLGSAFRYRLKSDRLVVANCHKQPSGNFTKELMTVEEISQGFDDLLKVVPSDVQIILTVSPVRHVRDTLELNAVSKSTLRLFCHRASSGYENVSYFPSYEIMIDDLRDYRFYGIDMLHPNETAIQYIWSAFRESFLSGEANHFIEKWKSIIGRLNHRPSHINSTAHQKFLTKTIDLLRELEKEVDIETELQTVQNQLNDAKE